MEIEKPDHCPNSIEAVSNRSLPRTEQRMLLESASHDELARRLNLSEISTAAICASVFEENVETPLTANAQVSRPPGLTVEIRVSPPPLHLISRAQRRRAPVMR
jgi:hypothetical protein